MGPQRAGEDNRRRCRAGRNLAIWSPQLAEDPGRASQPLRGRSIWLVTRQGPRFLPSDDLGCLRANDEDPTKSIKNWSALVAAVMAESMPSISIAQNAPTNLLHDELKKFYGG